MNKKIKIIFIGTPEFAVRSLQKIISTPNFEVVATITQPDKKIGRKQIITPTPVKALSENYRIPLFQPVNIRSIVTQIKQLDSDLIIVAAYAQIIPEEILSIPKYGCINIHGSLLPKYRGASCVQAAIENGERETGITVMKMDKGLDTGDVLARFNQRIEEIDTAGTLMDKLSVLAAQHISQVINEYIGGKILPIPQKNESASYCKQLVKQDGLIIWKKSAMKIARHIRAMQPWPGACSFINDKKVKIIEASAVTGQAIDPQIGELLIYNNELAVGCGHGILLIKKIQVEGKKVITGKEFSLGYKDLIGKILT